LCYAGIYGWRYSESQVPGSLAALRFKFALLPPKHSVRRWQRENFAAQKIRVPQQQNAATTVLRILCALGVLCGSKLMTFFGRKNLSAAANK
jgi:hypothetical protein